MPNTNHEPSVLAWLQQECRPATLPERWRFFPPDPQSRALALAPDELLAALRAAFPEETLVEQGVAIAEQGQLRLHPVLTTEDRIAFFPTDADGRPQDVITSRGSLRRHVPLSSLLNDPTTQQQLARMGRRVVVTGSMPDAMLLRSLGVPAAPAVGLSQLNRNGLAWLLSVVGGHCTKPLIPGRGAEDLDCLDSPNSVCAILLAYDLSTASVALPPQILAAAKHLAWASHCLHVHWQGIRVFQPSPTAIQDLDRRRLLGDCQLIQAFFGKLAKVEKVTDFVERLRAEDDPALLLTSLTKLLGAEDEARRHATTLHQRGAEASRARYHQIVDRKIVQRFLDRAHAEGDANQSAIQLQLAHLHRLFHREVPRVYEAQEKANRSTGRSEALAVADEGLQRLERLSSLCIQLTRESLRLETQKRRRFGGR